MARQAKPTYIETIPARVRGIPCQIGIERYFHQPPFRGSAWQCDSADDYYGWTECEWRVLDRRGRIAEWIERKLTDDDREEIETLISEHFAEDRRQDRDERAIDAAMDVAESRAMDRAMDLYEARFGL